jgi:membrane protein
MADDSPMTKVAATAVAGVALARGVGALVRHDPGPAARDDGPDGKGPTPTTGAATAAAAPAAPAVVDLRSLSGGQREDRTDGGPHGHGPGSDVGAEPGREDELGPADFAADAVRAEEPGRGRHAEEPGEIPARGWKDILLRTFREVKSDNVPLLAAGVAFYALLSLFPAVVAIVSIYGLAADPGQVADQLDSLTRPLPAQAADLIVEQVRTVASQPRSSLGISALVGIATALWSASSGMKWLLSALSLAYDEPERRKFLKLRGTALLLTLGAAVGLVASIGLIAASGALARAVGLGDTGELVAGIVRWPLLAVLGLAGLAVLYRYGPDRDPAKWRWVTWGSAAAGAIWLAASAGFAVYASVSGSFDESYGSLGGVVVLMLWLFLTVLAVLLGAEINSEMEHQTARDTTKGPDRPIGRRDATMADDVGPNADELKAAGTARG